MANRTVSVALQAKVSGFVNGMQTAAKAAGDFNKRLSKGANDNSQHLNQLSSTLGLVGAGMLGFAALAVKSFADFDAAMSKVQAATHESASNMKLLRDAAIEAGAKTAFSATDAASAIEEMAKAGVSTADILNGGLNGALSLAAAGSLEVGDAAETAATAMVQFGLSGDKVPHIADLLAAAAGKAQGSVSDMAMALKQGGLVAAQMGWSLDETTGVLAEFASAGLLGSDAGTSLKTMLLALANPSAKAADTMQQLGISAYDASGNFVGAQTLAGELRDRMKELDPATRNAALATIFGSDAIRAASILYKDGAKGAQEWAKKVNDSGYAAETAALNMDNLKGDLEQLSGSLETALIGMGEGANGPLRNLVQRLTEVVNEFHALPPQAQSATLAIAGGGGLALLGAAALVKLITTAGETVTAIRAIGVTAATARTALMFTGVATAILGVAYAGTKLTEAMDNVVGTQAVTNLDDMGKAMLRLGESGKASGALVSAFGSNFEGVTHKFIADGDSFGEAASRLANATWFDKLEGGFDAAKQSIDTMDKSLATLVTGGHAEEAGKAFDKLAEAAKKNGVSVAQLKKLFPEYTTAVGDAKAASKAAAEDVQKLGGSVDGTGAAAQQAEPPISDAADALKNMDDRAKGLDDSLQLLNATLGRIDAASAYEQAIDDASTRLKEFQTEVKKGDKATRGMSSALDLTTQAGRDNASAVREVWKRSSELAVQTLKTTGSQERANAVLGRGREQLVKVAAQFLGSRAAAEKYITKVLGIPKNVSTQYKTPGLPGANSQAGKLKQLADQLDGRVVTTRFQETHTYINVRKNVIQNKIEHLPGMRAKGGPVWPGGAFIVGEEGPEIVKFARSGTVIPHDESMRQLSRPQQSAPRSIAAGAENAAAVGDTYNFYPRSIDLNERSLQSVTHAARVRSRVGRPR